MKKLLFVLALLLPLAVFCQRGQARFSEEFDGLWGKPISAFKNIKYIKSEGDFTMYSMGNTDDFLDANIHGMGIYVHFYQDVFVEMVVMIDPAYVDLVLPRALELYGSPSTNAVSEHGNLKNFRWKQGNTEMQVYLDNRRERFDFLMVEVHYLFIDPEKVDLSNN